jgi:WxL domain surface cell wall-binding
MMMHLSRTTRRRVGSAATACGLLTGGAGAFVLPGAGTAQAAVCSGAAVAAGTTCTDTGTLTFTAGTLNLTSPQALAWGATDTGLAQVLVDPTTAHQSYLVDDATGGGLGWNVTVSATIFTSISPAATLPAGAFTTTGSVVSQTATTAPTAVCSSGATCTLPTVTGLVTFPVTIGTTATRVYNAAAASGLGSINIGYPGALPVGWWLTVPANAIAATYTSTVTLGVVSAP